jgi:hypothetical protein
MRLGFLPDGKTGLKMLVLSDAALEVLTSTQEPS